MKYLYIDFYGLERKIEFPNDYNKYIEKIKELFNISDSEFLTLKSTFYFYSSNLNFDFDVTNEKDFFLSKEISPQFNQILSKLLVSKKKKEEAKNEKIKEELNRFDIMEQSERRSLIFNNANIKKGKIPEKIKANKKKKKNLLNCKFLDNDIEKNHSINIYLNKIQENNPIEYKFRVLNNGKEKWPNDTLLKCENDDTEIYFFYVSINDDDCLLREENGIEYQEFLVKVLFKNYKKIKVGKYQLRAYLYSDKSGRIGNSYGKLIINVQINSNYFSDDINSNEIFENFDN